MKFIAKAQATLSNKGEGYVDSGVKILIAVAIGALLLVMLYRLLQNTIWPSVSNSVSDMFAQEDSALEEIPAGA